MSEDMKVPRRTVRDLLARQDRMAAEEERQGAEMFMGRPDRWFVSPHWRCPEGHVSTSYLKTEQSGAVCLACGRPIALTSPEDKGDG